MQKNTTKHILCQMVKQASLAHKLFGACLELYKHDSVETVERASTQETTIYFPNDFSNNYTKCGKVRNLKNLYLPRCGRWRKPFRFRGKMGDYETID